MPFPDFSALDRVGINLHAVFACAALPPAVQAHLRAVAPERSYRQLLLLGHGGTTLWSAVQAAGMASDHPIDDFTVGAVRHWLADQQPAAAATFLYPGGSPPDLQTLGRLAGWHHDSPFLVGLHADWGPWFAYRAVVLADTEFAPTEIAVHMSARSPCADCAGQPCRSACPAHAMADGGFALAACTRYRIQPDSACAYTCLARLACPVGRRHRYSEAQLRHAYAQSLEAIRRFSSPGADRTR